MAHTQKSYFFQCVVWLERWRKKIISVSRIFSSHAFFVRREPTTMNERNVGDAKEKKEEKEHFSTESDFRV